MQGGVGTCTEQRLPACRSEDCSCLTVTVGRAEHTAGTWEVQSWERAGQTTDTSNLLLTQRHI